jgi:chemotaxis protein CheX
MIETEKLAEFVRNAASEVFSTMLGMEIEAGPARFDQVPPTISDGILGIVGLAGSWTGAGAVSCTAAFACSICSHLLMTEAGSVNEDVLDAMGEVTNMIVGNFKTMVEETLGPLGLSIPTVVYGRNFTSRSLGQNEWVVVPFQCDGEQLDIRVCLAPSREPSSRILTHGSTLLV